MAEITTTERELKVRDRQNDIMQRVALLTNPKTKQIVVTNQEEADLASGLVTDSEMLRAEWKLEWYGTPIQPGDIPKADALHKSLVARWRRIDTPLSSIVTGCKSAINFWRIREQQKREQAALKLEAKEHKKGNVEFVAPREKVEAAGMTAVERWDAEVYWCEGKECACQEIDRNDTELKADLHYTQGLRLLVEAVAKKKADLVYVVENDEALRRLATDKHDMADNGYILPGVRVKKIEGLRRK